MKSHKIDYVFSALPTIIFLATMGWLEGSIYRQTGHILPPIDDPFIHTAMARHWAQDGVFGVSKAGFSASSSAPGWTALLGIFFYLFGYHESIPLILNILFATAFLTVWTWLLNSHIQNPAMTAILATFFLFIIPLPTITALGMEHPLHLLLTLLLVNQAVQIVTKNPGQKGYFELLIFGILSSLIRYETVFVIVPLGWIFLARNSRKPAGLLVLAYLLPIGILGLSYRSQGWYFFPNSILVKSILLDSGWEQINQFFQRLFGQLFHTGHLIVPFLLSGVLFFRSLYEEKAFSSRMGIYNFVFLFAALFHCSLSLIGWFYRYEAYLLALGFLAISTGVSEWIPKIQSIWNAPHPLLERVGIRSILITAALLPIVPFSRNIQSILLIVPGAYNLYQQQYQMGLFLRTYYSGKTIVANDIGAINTLADIVCLDLTGLGSIETMRAGRQNHLTAAFVDHWVQSQEAKIAMIYESWWRKIIPPNWIKVGTWTVDQKVSVADSTVTFYAIDPLEIESLKSHLWEFQRQLPTGVELNIF